MVKWSILGWKRYNQWFQLHEKTHELIEKLKKTSSFRAWYFSKRVFKRHPKLHSLRVKCLFPSIKTKTFKQSETGTQKFPHVVLQSIQTLLLKTRKEKFIQTFHQQPSTYYELILKWLIRLKSKKKKTLKFRKFE